MNEQKQIAQDAIFQIACAMEQIDWLRGVLYVLRDQLDRRNDHQYSKVADLALYNADDWHNQLDCELKTLEARTETAFGGISAALIAPEAKTLGRIPLAEFAKGRQHEIATRLGVRQSAISKAIREGRAIFVTEEACGQLLAVEEKAFPGQRRETEAVQ